MPRKLYTLSVLLCAASWLLVGLHVPALHDLTPAEVSRRWLPLALLAGFFVLAVADTWALLRVPARWARPPALEPPAA